MARLWEPLEVLVEYTGASTLIGRLVEVVVSTADVVSWKLEPKPGVGVVVARAMLHKQKPKTRVAGDVLRERGGRIQKDIG